jgi:hypothetical protein
MVRKKDNHLLKLEFFSWCVLGTWDLTLTMVKEWVKTGPTSASVSRRLEVANVVEDDVMVTKEERRVANGSAEVVVGPES